MLRHWEYRYFVISVPSEIDAVSHPLITRVTSLAEACKCAGELGQRILLTTGSKELADYVRLLPGKTLLARVLPTSEVIGQCEELGLGVEKYHRHERSFYRAI